MNRGRKGTDVRRGRHCRSGAALAARGLAVTAASAVVIPVVLLATPGVAFAHGVTTDGQGVSDFLWSGFVHMITGWDHLLFLAGIVLLARQIRRSITLASVFAAGHSLTLVTATLTGWRLDPTAVDVVIALSVVFVGLACWVGWPGRWRSFAAAVFAFGLVHGLGLAARLQDLGLPHDGVVARMVAFNVGVEIGQVLALIGIWMIGDVLRHYLPSPHAARYAPIALTAVGTVTTVVLATLMVTATV